MLVFQRLTGWHNDSINQKHISIYTELKAKGDIRFLGGVNGKELLLPYLVDISKTGNAILVTHYPHTDASVLPKIDTPEYNLVDKTLVHLYQTLVEKYQQLGQPERNTFTIDLYNMCEIMPSDFRRFSPGNDAEKAGICAFIVSTEDEEGGFPTIYVLERRVSEESKAVWPLFGIASRCLSNPVKQKIDGKYLSFLLLNANHKRKFIGFSPNLASVEFPTSNFNKVPPFYKTDELDKLLDNPKINSLKVKSGKIVDELPDETVVPDFIMGEINEKEMGRIIKDMMDKNLILLSDILQIGSDDALKFFPKTVKPVNVAIDVAQYVAKMCVFEGFYYAIPKDDEESRNNLLADFGDNLVICNDASFPAIS